MKTMGLRILGFLFVACITWGCSSYPDATSIHGTVITKAVNEPFELKFEGCPTCGYSWFMEPVDTLKISVVNKTVQSTNPNPGMVGGNAIEIWTLAGHQRGEYQLEFYYKRPWLDTIEKRQRVKVVIN